MGRRSSGVRTRTSLRGFWDGLEWQWLMMQWPWDHCTAVRRGYLAGWLTCTSSVPFYTIGLVFLQVGLFEGYFNFCSFVRSFFPAYFHFRLFQLPSIFPHKYLSLSFIDLGTDTDTLEGGGREAHVFSFSVNFWVLYITFGTMH